MVGSNAGSWGGDGLGRGVFYNNTPTCTLKPCWPENKQMKRTKKVDTKRWLLKNTCSQPLLAFILKPAWSNDLPPLHTRILYKRLLCHMKGSKIRKNLLWDANSKRYAPFAKRPWQGLSVKCLIGCAALHRLHFESSWLHACSYWSLQPPICLAVWAACSPENVAPSLSSYGMQHETKQ